MGWASGSGLAASIWSYVRPKVKQADRKLLAQQIIEIFKEHDCDTLYECTQLMRDADLPKDQGED